MTVAPPHRFHLFVKKFLSFLFLALALLAMAPSPALATGVYDLPTLGSGSKAFLIDQAETISLANENRLNGDLKKLAQSTGQEVRFVVIRRLDFDVTIDGFADDLFSRWYPDAESQANQTLLVLDTLTNSTALRRGDTAATLLTDDIVDSLLRETVAVPLKDGAKYNQALIEADKRLSAVLAGETDPGPPPLKKLVWKEPLPPPKKPMTPTPPFGWLCCWLWQL